FFLYIIFLFGDALSYSTNVLSGTSFADKAMKVIIPFFILFILLQMAKKMAVEYSGAIGAMLMKATAAVGGLALGGVVGGAALLGTGAVGLASGASRKFGWGESLRNAGVDEEGKAKKGMGAFFARTAL